MFALFLLVCVSRSRVPVKSQASGSFQTKSLWPSVGEMSNETDYQNPASSIRLCPVGVWTDRTTEKSSGRVNRRENGDKGMERCEKIRRGQKDGNKYRMIRQHKEKTLRCSRWKGTLCPCFFLLITTSSPSHLLSLSPQCFSVLCLQLTSPCR